MSCQRCGGKRVLKACGKTSDMCCLNLDGRVYDGYVPRDANIGGGDYLDVQICLECGQAQGKWPVSNAALPDELSVGYDESSGQKLSWEDLKPDNMHGAGDGFGGEDFPSSPLIVTKRNSCCANEERNARGRCLSCGSCCLNEDRSMSGGCRSCGDPCL